MQIRHIGQLNSPQRYGKGFFFIGARIIKNLSKVYKEKEVIRGAITHNFIFNHPDYSILLLTSVSKN